MERPDRYSRQIVFPGIGPEGQQRLSEAFDGRVRVCRVTVYESATNSVTYRED